jgi:molecular chaperone GrpE (heat shock protein)
MPKHLVSLAMVQKKLKDAFVKLGVEEIPIEEGKTHFDSELHDGEPVKADDERAKGLEKGTIVGTARAGYRSGDLLIRAAKVLVVG